MTVVCHLSPQLHIVLGIVLWICRHCLVVCESSVLVKSSMTLLLSSTSLLLLLPNLLPPATAGPPNILVLVVEDLGWDDVSWHNPAVIMPNIGTLARQGVVMEQVGDKQTNKRMPDLLPRLTAPPLEARPKPLY